MNETLFEQYANTQKTMLENWQKTMGQFFQQPGGHEGSTPKPDAAQETPLTDAYQNASETFQTLWKKTTESAQAYQALSDLWKQLNEKNTALDAKTAGEIFDLWSKQYFAWMKEAVIPNSPEEMNDFLKKYTDKCQSTAETFSTYAKATAEYDEALREAFLNAQGKGPKGYIEFLEAWQERYDKTLGKLMNAPTFGKDMDFWKHQKSSLDRYIRYTIASTKFYTALAEIADAATKKVVEDYVDMAAQGTQPKTFDEFYKYWSKFVSKSYEKILFRDEIGELAGDMVDEMAQFKKESDKLYEFYLENFPIPKKSDMDDLYNTIHTLKKEVRALKKDVQLLKAQLEKPAEAKK